MGVAAQLKKGKVGKKEKKVISFRILCFVQFNFLKVISSAHINDFNRLIQLKILRIMASL